jgi:hypothetical protein
MRRKVHLLLVLAAGLCAPLAGCGTPQAVRDLTETQAGVLNTYRTSMQAVAGQQGRLNADNERRVRDLADLRAHNDAYVAQRLTGFSVSGDKAAAEIYGVIVSRNASDVIARSAAIAELTPAPAAPQVSFDSAEVNGLVKALKAVGAQQTPWARAIQTFAYLQASAESLKDAAAEGDDAKIKTAGDAVTAVAAKGLSKDLSEGAK